MAEGQPPSHGVRCFLALAAAAVDSHLSKGDVACLSVLLNRFNVEKGEAWPSVNRIATEAAIHRTSVMSSIKRLNECGYLAIDRGGLGKSNRYRPTFKTGSAGATGSVDTTSSADTTKPVVPTRPELVAPTLPEHTYRTKPKNLPIKSTRFADFWQAYPRKAGSKQKAEKSWDRQNLDHLADQLIANVTDRTSSDPRWSDPQYIPHPLTYLNNQRWNDEWAPGARRPSATDKFTDKSYQGSTDEELPDWMRSAA